MDAGSTPTPPTVRMPRRVRARLGDIVIRRADRAQITDTPQRFALVDCEGEVFEGNCFACLRRFIRQRNDLIATSQSRAAEADPDDGPE